MRRFLLVIALCLAARPAAALDAAAVEKLAFGESDDQVAAVNALVAAGDEKALPLLQALTDGAVTRKYLFNETIHSDWKPGSEWYSTARSRGCRLRRSR